MGRAKRYDPNAHHPHQHLVCSGCGMIRDVHPIGNALADLPDVGAVRVRRRRGGGHLPRPVPVLRLTPQVASAASSIRRTTVVSSVMSGAGRVVASAPASRS